MIYQLKLMKQWTKNIQRFKNIKTKTNYKIAQVFKKENVILFK